MSHAGPYRLAQGGLVDRTRPIAFHFNGAAYAGYEGDSVASALLANGVRTVARSFKFHRPRGVYSCGLEEPNALLALWSGARATPSERAPAVELVDGLEARSQAGWPGLNFEVGRILDFTAPLWAAGFYNKTFKWPNWHTYEGIIRRMAGLGRAPKERDPDRYDVCNLHCDVLVVGGGVAGLKAALEAGRAGARVVLVDEHHQFGGSASWNGAPIDGSPGTTWLAHTRSELSQLAGARMLSRTTATGYYDHNVVALLERAQMRHPNASRERYWIVRAQRVVLATGALEQPLIFSNNDRPGIMLAGSARQYLRRYGVAIGRRLLIATNNDSAYALAGDFKEAGVAVLGIVDSRHEVSDELRESLRLLSIPVMEGSIPVDTSGFSGLRSVSVGRLSDDGARIESIRMFKCDALAVSGGWNPTLHLFAQAGGKLSYDEASGSLRPVSSHPSIEIVGSASGGGYGAIGPRVSPVGKSRRQWVDLLHDVTVADLELALRENYTAVEHMKRYTTVGMAADQGKTATVASIEVLAKLRGVKADALGHTTMRPPFVPVTLGAIAGREIGERFAPRRLLPMHQWHEKHGALFHDFGEWRRPIAYLRDGESRERASWRETRAVREAAGLFDGSPLGKIEVQGPDAREFLDHFYINNLTTLKVGRVRYGIMLRESGVIFDDGTIAMLAPGRFVITTTSGNAGRVYQWLEEWHQCEWPQLRVAITAVTDQWATLSLAGPRARDILSTLDSDIDLSPAAFPHLNMREGTILGHPARIYRVSFTGELTYEINVPADAGLGLWDALLDAGEPHGLQPLGLDALLLMRLEKGFLHVGSDTDGTTVPDDVGWGKAAAGKSADFIGQRSLRLPENQRSDRLQLVGLSGRPGSRFVIGSHLRVKDSKEPTDGWITSAGAATLTNEPIALAMLRGGRARIGAEIDLYDAGVLTGQARVVIPPFYDTAGARMNG
jgi:sarcosine oxidase subunit alpha